MNKGKRTLLTGILMVLMYAMPVFAEPLHCAECGMMVDEASHFTARIILGGNTLAYCDIGDLMTYLKKKGRPEMKPLVRDFKSGDWLNADKAWYVQSDSKFKTPMSWGIAAFKSRKEAEAFGTPLDFSAVQKMLSP